MKRELLENIRKSSNNATLEPPSRIWNRLEYKLDRYEFDKKKSRKNKLIYLSSIAAVLITIISLIGFLKQDSFQYNIDNKSEFILDNYNNSNANSQVYDVHILHNAYSKQMAKTVYEFKELKVNQKIN